MLSDLRAIFGWIDGRLRLRWLLLVPVISVAALLEAVGAIAVFGLMRLVIEPHRVRTAPVVSQIWQSWPTDDPPAIVAALIGVVGAFYIGRALYLSWAEWVKEGTIARSSAQAAERLFARYLTADYLFHRRRRSSTLIQEVSRSTDLAFQLVAGSVLQLAVEFATIAALVAVLLFTAPRSALIAVAVVLGVMAVPILATRRLWMRVGERQKVLEEQQLHVLQQSLGAVKEVKIAGRESFFEGRLRAARRALGRAKQQRAWMGTTLRVSVETVLIVAMMGVVLLVMLREATGAETASILALFAYTGFRVVPSANRLMLFAGFLREGREYIRIALSDSVEIPAPPARPHGGERADFRVALVCEHVSFTYEDGAVPALTDINLTVRPGESIGLVGATGSGKSTLVDLLLGLLRPTAGRILLDGRDLAGQERAWQRLIGYVPQDPYLLDDTIRRNIAFGVPDALIDDARIARAVALARLDDVIRQLPQGLETPLTEQGMRFSGGQRQRVAIARALYHDPAVVVFDEATAALDNLTEREVTSAINALRGERTLIVIAHRLSTVRACDRLIFLENGRVAAVGTYTELLGNRTFQRMAAAD